MNHEQFDHVVRAAGAILGEEAIVVIGSQAILASVDQLPPAAVRSIEVDVLPMDGSPEKADLIDGSIGEASMFQDAFGIYAQGVGPETAVLPAGWRDRLVDYSSPSTNGVTARCLEPHDLAVAKLVAGRDKDADFVTELFTSGIIELSVILDRLTMVENTVVPAADLEARARRWAAG